MKKLLITKTLKTSSSRRGQSVVEALMAMLVMGVSIWGSISVYRTLGRSEKAANDKAEIVLNAARIRGLAAYFLMAEWRMLSKSDCTPSQLGAQFMSALLAPGDLLIMDKEHLDAIIPAGPLRDQITQISAKADAFKACSDPEVLKDPTLNLIAGSAYNQALCRCAAATTTYATYKPALDDVSDYRNVYGCVMTATGTEVDKLVYEVSGYATDMVSGNRLSCKEMDGVPWNTMLKRVDYTTTAEGTGMNSISGTYYMPVLGEGR